ncbi:hypothetical protein QC764_600340 [Podospora pseudoanserina]|uniref:C2H2-type domain-containing protein n=1 Tax=Podospora pseudoanserina TaxID=2609844 RepID=A0ABR0HU51_9PEZI|nr:hypothetical protein QC764_600340 [Podospora pseudoanserina]
MPRTFQDPAANGSIESWIFGGRDKSASTGMTTPAKENPTLPPPADSGSEPPPIISDILPPRTATHSPAVQFASTAQGDAGLKGTKYTTDAERRKAISDALKRRRTSGANDQSHGQHKKLQTVNFQPTVISPVPLPAYVSAQSLSRPTVSAPAPASSSSTSETSDVEMMDQLDPVFPPENIPDDSNDGDWEEGSEVGEVSVLTTPVNSQVQAEAAEVAKVEPHALDLTPSGRPYLRWNNESMYGTTIPDGYEWSSARPGFPWICPVRSCRKLFPAIKQLGGHFVRQHRGSLLHDNMDGTLSVRGHYAKLRDGEGQASGAKPKPGIVVSVGALDPSEPLMVAPSLPEQGHGRYDVDNSQPPSGAGSEYSGAQSPMTSLAKPSGKPSSLYLRHFKGREPPSKGHVRTLLSLPQLPDFDWNHMRIRTNPFSDTNPRDITALILQVTGEPAPKSCGRGASGNGLFQSCVMISPRAPDDITYCTLKDRGRERAGRILRSGQGAQQDYEDPGWDDADISTSNVSEQAVGLLTANTTQTSPTVSSSDGFEFASPGRRYTEWDDDNGDPRSLCGVMIPAGYTELSGPRPFRCPIRSCETKCIKVKDLGFHFSRSHYASYLKDNGDGSFDLVGVYAPKRGNIGPSGKILHPRPSIVVAKTRPDGSVEWAANWWILRHHMLPATAAADVPVGDEALANRSWPPKSTWDHMEAEEKTSQGAVAEENASRMAAEQQRAAEQQSPAEPMANVMAGRSLRRIPGTNRAHMNVWLPGVKTPGVMRKEQQQQYRMHTLRWSDVHQRPVPPRPKSPQAAQATAQAQQAVPQAPQVSQAEQPADIARNAAVEGVEEEHEGVSTRYKLRARTSESGHFYPQAPPPAPAEPDESIPEEPAPPSPIVKHQRRQPKSRILEGIPSSNGVQTTGFIIAEQVLEMEDWEVAPGRIREMDPKSESIAFSKSFLSSTHAVEVCEDVAFRVDVIRSGQTFKIEGEENQLRLVSLAAGKLRVKIGEEPEFVMGPHGMFKVKAGAGCTVRNRMYVEAIIHTTVLNGFS